MVITIDIELGDSLDDCALAHEIKKFLEKKENLSLSVTGQHKDIFVIEPSDK